MNVKTRGYVAVVAACGVGALAVAAGNDQVRRPYMFGLLAIAAIATELFEVRADVSALDGSGSHSFSFSSGIHLAAVMVVGPWQAALIAAGGVVVVDYLRGSELIRVLFNASSFALATLAAGLVYEAAGATPGALALPADFGAIAAMALVYVSVNRALVSVIVSLTSKIPLRQVLRQACGSDMGSTAGEISLGVTLAFFVLSDPWEVVALGPLVLAVYLAHARLTAAKEETARALETFANVVDERDPYTYRHSVRVAEHVERLGEALGLSPADVARLRWAGRLHDLGKVAVDAAVLRKPARLDDREWATLRRHPRLSARLLLDFRFATATVRAVEYHHERYDGRGYYGIAATATPIGAHFLAVADSYDAMVTDRPYRRGLSVEHALEEIENGMGTQFHPVPAKAFVALIRGEDPLAALDDGERALLGTLWRPRERTRRGRLVLVRNRAEFLAIAGVVGILASATLGRPAFGALGVAAVAAGVLLARRRDGRARHLAETLDAALENEPTSSRFLAIATPIARTARVRWIGLARWHQELLSGSLEEELSFGGCGTPSEDALTSWLLRDAEETDGLVQGSAVELGGTETYLAVPLRNEGITVGYIVVLFEAAAPRHVQLALAAVAPRLARLLPEPELRLAAAGTAR
jgi:putative nucleotidyltransferase with HDIG domain